MINFEEYTLKQAQFLRGEISEDEWRAYCFELLKEVTECNKDVLVRLKNR